MNVIANSQLTGIYGTVAKDEPFNCPDEVAKELLANRKVRLAGKPIVRKEIKVIKPPEVGPTVPFRDGSLSDSEPKIVPSSSNKKLSRADSSRQRTSHSRGRRR